MSVHYDNLASLSELKVQSNPLRPNGLKNTKKFGVKIDEMNMLAAQCVQAQIELERIADVKYQILTPQSSAPIIAIKEDALVGSFNMTADDLILDWRTSMNILSATKLNNYAVIIKDKNYPGKDIYSTIIPKKINMFKGDAANTIISIKNGEIIGGRVVDAVIGAKKKNNLIQLVLDEYGVDGCVNILDNITRLANNFNLYHGMTVGIGDLDVSNDLFQRMYQVFQTKKTEVKHEITEYENNPDMLDEDLFETSIKQKLDIIRDDVGKLIFNNLKPNNNMKIMNQCGSKGSIVNMGQMGGCVGNQDFQGSRMPKNYNDRTLPYFFKNDDSAEARGFIEGSYLNGINLSEFLFHHVAGREGLIDQALKSVTPDTKIFIKNSVGNIECIAIGDFIDNLMKHSLSKVDINCINNSETLQLDDEISIPTVDEDGYVSWGLITSLTRHDACNELYEIITESGRVVKVPETKSLLVWENNKFVEKNTPLINVNDKVPVMRRIDTQGSNNLNENSENTKFFEILKFNSQNKHVDINNELFEVKNIETIHDVVLDRIIEIKKLDPKDYPKLYDLTVPSTYNFILANGLGVRDTASSGYLQRKFIKAAEDFMVKYDGTVRNAVDRIQQFIYGDSGIDTVRQYDYKFKIMDMNNAEVADKFKFTKDELKQLKNYTEKDNDAFYKELLTMRDHLRETQIRASLNYLALNSNYMFPVNINRIIDSVKSETSKEPVLNEPEYIFKLIDYILQADKCRLYSMTEDEMKNPKCPKAIDDKLSKTAFKYALYESLAPKKCISVYKLTKKQIDDIANQIINSFNRSVVEPGEMVGILGAQSLGEPVTQMVLNSVDWKEEILVRDVKLNKDFVVPIGKFIDETMESDKELVVQMGDNLENNMKGIYYLDTKDKNYFIQSVNEDGKISWKKIEAFTKHLPINKDGSDTLIKVTTRMGKTVIATKGKSFLTQKDNKILPIRGDEIKVGDYLPIMKNYNNDKEFNFDNGYYDIYPSVKLETIKQTNFRRDKLKDLLKLNISEIDKNTINTILNIDVYFDEIMSIDEVKPSNTYVYDFTIEETQNFIMANGLCMRDSFHSTGLGMNAGVPRIQEVFSLSKNLKAPIMMVYLDKEHRTKKDYATKIRSYIKFTTIKDLRTKIDIYYDDKPYEKGGFMEKDNVYNIFYAFQQSKSCCLNKVDGLPWLMRIEFDKEKLMNKEVSLLDIKSKFCVEWEKRYQDIKGMKREKRQILDRITQLAVLTNSENDTIPIMHVRFDMTNYNSSTLIDFMDMFIDEFKLKGLPDIADIIEGSESEPRMITFDNPEGNLETKNTENVIITSGINMTAIRNIIGVDLTRTYCNDIIMTYEMFGIEAARALIIKEITSVFAANGSPINSQHISIFGDLMTNVGTLTSIDRHGLNKLDTDPLARASFEKTVEQLITAAVFNEIDHMKSVSSRIMAGLCIKGGTGLCNLVLDIDLLENSEYTSDIGQLYNKTFDDIVPSQTKHEVDNEVFIPEF